LPPPPQRERNMSARLAQSAHPRKNARYIKKCCSEERIPGKLLVCYYFETLGTGVSKKIDAP
jgi:hypothetical protein